MAKKKEKMYLDASTRCFMINGEEYILGASKTKKIDGIVHIDKTLLVKVDFKKKMKKIDSIVKEFGKVLSKKEVLRELLSDKLCWSEIDKLEKILKTKPKIRKQKGCLGIKIGTGKKKDGGMYVGLID